MTHKNCFYIEGEVWFACNLSMPAARNISSLEWCNMKLPAHFWSTDHAHYKWAETSSTNVCTDISISPSPGISFKEGLDRHSSVSTSKPSSLQRMLIELLVQKWTLSNYSGAPQNHLVTIDLPTIRQKWTMLLLQQHWSQIQVISCISS